MLEYPSCALRHRKGRGVYSSLLSFVPGSLQSNFHHFVEGVLTVLGAEELTGEEMVRDGQPLPAGVYDYKYENAESEYYTIYTPDISTDELLEMLTYKKLGYLRTIKNCAVYFVVLSVIAICAYLIILVQMA